MLPYSNLLNALGWALTHSLWQTAVIWLLYKFITKAIINQLQHKINLAIIAITLSFSCFVYTLTYGYTNTQFNFSLVSTLNQDILGITFNHHSFVVIPYLSVIYLLLLLYHILQWIKELKAINVLRTQEIYKVPAQYKIFVQEQVQILGITKKVKVYLSKKIITPATIGFLKPIILLPFSCTTYLTPTQIEAILIHELKHIKRNDFLINIFITLIQKILFFNPFIIWMYKDINAYREKLCDDTVLNFKYNALDYAQSLLAFAKKQQYKSIIALNGAEQPLLLQRIQRLMGLPLTTHHKTKRTAFTILGLFFFVILTMLTTANKMAYKQVAGNKYIKNNVETALASKNPGSSKEKNIIPNKLEVFNTQNNPVSFVSNIAVKSTSVLKNVTTSTPITQQKIKAENAVITTKVNNVPNEIIQEPKEELQNYVIPVNLRLDNEGNVVMNRKQEDNNIEYIIITKHKSKESKGSATNKKLIKEYHLVIKNAHKADKQIIVQVFEEEEDAEIL